MPWKDTTYSSLMDYKPNLNGLKYKITWGEWDNIMEMHAKYEINLEDFKPVNFKDVRWLNEEDFHYMNEFWNMSLETWNGAKEEGFTYCAVIQDNRIVSVAAVWKYSQNKWEVAAVNTRQCFENRGLAKQVVSFVTDYILSQNKTPTLTTGKDNMPMRKVAEKIGFKLVGLQNKAYDE